MSSGQRGTMQEWLDGCAMLGLSDRITADNLQID